MANINELLARAAALRDETQLNSISPERAGGIMYDTLLAMNELWLQQGAALVISKIYASVAAMEADTAPVSDLTGLPLRPGQIVVIASSDSDNGSVYRYNGTSSPSWSLVGEIGNLEPVDSLNSDSTSLPLAAHQGKVLDGKISQLGQDLINDTQFDIVKRGNNSQYWLSDISAVVGESYYVAAVGNSETPLSYPIEVYINGHYNESDKITLSTLNTASLFTPLNSDQIRGYQPQASNNCLFLVANSRTLTKGIFDTLIDLYSKNVDNIRFSQQTLSSAQKLQAQTNLGLAVTNSVEENSLDIPTSGSVYNKVVPLYEQSVENSNVMSTDIVAELGKSYIVYLLDDTTMPPEGISVYRDGNYSAADKILITETNKLYTFTPISQAENRKINLWSEGGTLAKIHLYISESTSVISDNLRTIIPIYKRLEENPARSLLAKINVGEWNIGYWNNGVSPYGVPDEDVNTYLPRVKSLLTTICSDILVITEWVTYFDRSQTMPSYDTLLKQFYPHKYTERGDNKPAIFSKFPVVGSEGTFITDGAKYSKGIININGKEIIIVAIHLPSAESDRNRRIQMFTDIVNEYQDSPYVIVTGDTNIYNLDELQPFITAGWVLGNGGYFGNISTWYTGTWYIDNVITKGFNIDDFVKVEDDNRAGVSDHYPVKSIVSTML